MHGYASGLYSSRRIARACRERNDFVMIVALDPPDFRTISDFRKRHLKALGALFLQILQLCETRATSAFNSASRFFKWRVTRGWRASQAITLFMGGIVVEDDADGLLRWNRFLDGVEEADELLMAMALHTPTMSCTLAAN